MVSSPQREFAARGVLADLDFMFAFFTASVRFFHASHCLRKRKLNVLPDHAKREKGLFEFQHNSGIWMKVC